MNHFSGYTSFAYREYMSTESGRPGVGPIGVTHATDLAFTYQGEHYLTRLQGHLSQGEIALEEERFLERRHGRPRRF